MSQSNLSSRVATGFAIAFATAAISACGGGSTDSQTTTDEAATTSVGNSGTATVAGTNASSAATKVSTVPSPVASTTATTPATTASSSTSSITASSTTSIAAPITSPTTTSGLLTVTGNDTAPVTTTPATNTATDALPATTPKVVAASMARPAGNTGTGFFVADGKLYDAKGVEFHIGGVNRIHWDSPGGGTGVALSGANTMRIALDYTRAPSSNIALLTTQALANKIVPMPGNWGGTCKTDPAVLSGIVDTWVAQAPTFIALNTNGLINIANEWGPEDSTVWRDSYITAIGRMRAAGYTGTLVVDSGGCGQNAADVINYGAAVLAGDPQHNVLFDVHVYGNFYYPATVAWQQAQDYTSAMAKLKATNLAMVLGEFGPGKNIGPSPTLITPQTVIATATANDWGYIAWAWDDNNLANCGADNNWFSMTVSCGFFKTTADLTLFGQAIVPYMQQTAVKASIFN